MDDPDYQKEDYPKNNDSSAAAEHFKSDHKKEDNSKAPPSSPVQLQVVVDPEKSTEKSGSDAAFSMAKGAVNGAAKAALKTDPVKQELENKYNELKLKHKNKSKIFDGLAAYIASKTKPRRMSKKGGGTFYIVTGDSMKISGNKEAMQFLHKIGYWKDKPRRLVNAAQKVYAEWTETADENGKRTRSLSENGIEENLTKKGKRDKKAEDDTSTTNLEKMVGLIRPDKEVAKKEDKDRRAVDKKDKNTTASNPDGVLKMIRKGDFAWSAVTISYMHHLAGSGDTFAYSEGHITYARAAKANKNKDNIEGLEKLYPAFGKEAKKVKMGDTLHRSRKTHSTYNKIKSTTHSDIVVGFKVFKIESVKDDKKKNKKSYTEVDEKTIQKEYAEAKTKNEELTIQEFYQSKGYQKYAIVIGGNTSDHIDPGTKTEGGEGGTVGQNFIPLNPDNTLKEKTGRNNKSYSKKDAYFGVQRTDYDEP